MAYRLPAATETDPGAPLTSELMKAFAGNPEGVANGDAGAPSIKDAALDTGAATPAGTDWVAKRAIAAAAGDIGTLAFGLWVPTSSVAFGDEKSGGSIAPSNSIGTDLGGSLGSGTMWRCLGAITSSAGPGDPQMATLWQRVS